MRELSESDALIAEIKKRDPNMVTEARASIGTYHERTNEFTLLKD